MFFLRAQCVQKKRDRENAARLVPADVRGEFDMPRSFALTVIAWIMLIGGFLCGIGSTFVVIYGAVNPPAEIAPCNANVTGSR
jgi:hypothetical protein